jgi:hypothetical protein
MQGLFSGESTTTKRSIMEPMEKLGRIRYRGGRVKQGGKSGYAEIRVSEFKVIASVMGAQLRTISKGKQGGIAGAQSRTEADGINWQQRIVRIITDSCVDIVVVRTQNTADYGRAAVITIIWGMACNHVSDTQRQAPVAKHR